MTREEKSVAIEDLTAKLAGVNVLYLADTSGLDAVTTSNLRKACFKANIKLEIVKNTLLAKAMESSDIDFGNLASVLKGNTSLMIAEVGSAPAKVIKEFRLKNKKPILKGAYITEEIYIGDENLDNLAALRSRTEMIGEIIGLLQSPAQRVIAALQNQDKTDSAE